MTDVKELCLDHPPTQCTIFLLVWKEYSLYFSQAQEAPLSQGIKKLFETLIDPLHGNL